MANPEHVSLLHKASGGMAPDADFTGSDLSGVRLSSARLAGMRFGGANFRRANLAGAYFQNADLSQANLAQARLTLTDLRQANLRSASLKSADLNSAVLQGADLSDADLAKCILIKAILTDAKLTGANLAGADLRGVRGATALQIQAAKNWRKAIFDPPMAKMLGIEQDAEISRHGKPPRKPKSRRSITVDVLCANAQPTFGDLFVICDDVHPLFPPSGHCDLSHLAKLGFQQTDDYFAIQNSEQDPIVWLYPLVRGEPVEHHKGPFEGVRLDLPRATKATAPRFLAALTAFTDALGGPLHDVVDDRRFEATSLAEVRARIDSFLSK